MWDRRVAAFSVEVITLAPDLWPVVLGEQSGLVGKAFGGDRPVGLQVRNLRDYGKGAHSAVDDAPFGGGAGMLLCVEPLHRAIEDARARTPGPVILLSPRGQRFDQAMARQLAVGEGMVIVCGRYEGYDERVRAYVDVEMSVGDYVLSAGDPAAWCIVDAVVRLLPGVLGNPSSIREESFGEGSTPLEYPQYTRPAQYDGVAVPEVLRGGDHAAVGRWRRQQAAEISAAARPDLLGEERSREESP